MVKQIKSLERVRDRGEVFTNIREVNAMLDLVKLQVHNPEATFLEPACGTGNFLIAILEQKLKAIARYKKNQKEWEEYAIIVVGSLYGIDINSENVSECRFRLFQYIANQYSTFFAKKKHNTHFLDTIEYILTKNIIVGDALEYKTEDNTPIIFSKWSSIGGGKIKRIDSIFDDLFNDYAQKWEKISQEIGNYPPIHYDKLYQLEGT